MTRVFLTLTLLAAGCSFSPRAFDHGALARAVRVDSHSVSDQQLAGAVAVRPDVKLPLKLAVWFRPPNPWRWSEYRVRWQEEDRDGVLAALRPLADAGIISEPFVIVDSVFPGDGVRAARFAAALHEADAVLIVTGATAVQRHSTPAALLYPTIVGLWTAPGSRAEGYCLAAGSLWDVRNGFLYAAAEAEAMANQTFPIMLVDEDKVIAGAKRKALATLVLDLELRLRRMGEAASVARAR